MVKWKNGNTMRGKSRSKRERESESNSNSNSKRQVYTVHCTHIVRCQHIDNWFCVLSFYSAKQYALSAMRLRSLSLSLSRAPSQWKRTDRGVSHCLRATKAHTKIYRTRAFCFVFAPLDCVLSRGRCQCVNEEEWGRGK